MNRIPLNRIYSDTRNANRCDTETLDKLQRNIARTGNCPPLIVRPHPNKPKDYMLIDGHHRKLVLERLGWTEVECQIWEVGDDEARIALATLNRLRGEDNPRKRAELIDSLLDSFAMEDLTQWLPETPQQINDLLSLLAFDMEALESSLKEQIQREQVTLPVPYTFLIPPESVDLVEETLKAYQQNQVKSTERDRGEAFVRICSEAAKVILNLKEI